MPRIFSGIQPSGELHVGNWLGAVQNWVTLQLSYDCIYCVVDLHAVTGKYEQATLTDRTREMAIGLLASGIDPARVILFVQSHVPEHSELQWLLNTITPIGELERMTQFKDKSQRFESVPAGLLNYPILMAADILLYRADLVPVGDDQTQQPTLERHQDTFRQQLAHKPPASRADRKPDGHFPGSRSGTGELEIRDIGAGDQQENTHRPKQQLQTPLHFVTRDGDIEVVGQRGSETFFRKPGRILLRQLQVEAVQLLLGHRRRHAGLQARDREDASLLPGIRAQRQPQPATRPPAETRRHHADDSIGLIIQPKRLADGVRVPAEKSLPQLIG